jgi:uncharacterized protein YutE (UPF0331/DUF86 family)
VFDENRLAKNKRDLLDARSRIQSLTAPDKDTFLADPRNALSVKYLLVEAVEAMSDTCQHLLGKSKGMACEGYVDCIVKAGEQGIISGALSSKLRRLADLRNHLVHRYWIIDDSELYRLCRENLRDLQEFADEVDRFLRP